MLHLDNVEVGLGGQKKYVERFQIVNKIIAVLLVPIIVSIIYIDQIILNKQYVFKNSDLPKNIALNIPLMKKKIYIDINTKNNNCQKNINNILNILYENKKISLLEMNKLTYGSSVVLHFDNIENASNDCTIIVQITDPYGNLDKELIFIVLPVFIILYMIFKYLWKIFSRLYNQKPLRKSRYTKTVESIDVD